MKTKDLVKSALHTAVGVGGGVAGQELGKLVPATVDPLYTEIGKVVVGGLIIPMLVKGKYAPLAASFGGGMAVVAGVNLVNQYVMPMISTPAAPVSGIDNRDYAMMGVDNRDYAVMGNNYRNASSQINTPGSVQAGMAM